MVDAPRCMAPEELLGHFDAIQRKYAPELLYLRGDTSLITKGVRVAVVGSRKASPLGLRRAEKVARLLVENGVIVVSGLAEGVDTVAHRTAIEAGGRTIAVLGTPLERVFPAENRELQERIAEDHLVLSQFPPDSRWDKRSFPMRNRTMALFSDAIVIVEAGERSGTINQGWEALRLGRPLYLLDSLVRSGQSWTHEMMKHGAEVLSDSNREAFLENLPAESRVERIEATF